MHGGKGVPSASWCRGPTPPGFPCGFPCGRHTPPAIRNRTAALSGNYVLVIASLVPVVYQLTVKASVKLRGHLPKLAERGGIFIGQITPMLLAGNYHFAFSSRPDFAGV